MKIQDANFLMGKGVWSFINGDEHEPILGASPTAIKLKTFKEWHGKAKKVMYWLSITILDSMIVHIQDAEMLKEAGDILVKVYSTNTIARKMQLK